MRHVEFSFRTLDHSTWPSDGREYYENCRFKASYGKTLSDLSDELRRIGVTRAVIEADVTERDVRLDNQLRSGARPSSPRVRISFKHPQIGPLQYPCDTYGLWTDNLRAIALTLAAQRAMERYGATRRHQQYTGWKQLPDSNGLQTAMTVEQAARWLDEALPTSPYTAKNIAADGGEYRHAYRSAAMKFHPDRGGNQADFVRLQEVKRVLDQHHQTTARS